MLQYKTEVSLVVPGSEEVDSCTEESHSHWPFEEARHRIIQALGNLFRSKETESPMMPVIFRLGRTLELLKIKNALLLEINDSETIFSDTDNNKEDLSDMINEFEHSEGKLGHLDSIKILMEHVPDKSIVMVINFELTPCQDRKTFIAITIEGSVQMPPVVSAKSFSKDIEEALTNGYFENAEKKLQDEYKRIMKAIIKGLNIKVEDDLNFNFIKSIIAPPKCLKPQGLYNRDFSKEAKIYPILAYHQSNIGYSEGIDPFDYLFWSRAFDFVLSSGEEYECYDCTGTIISLEEGKNLFANDVTKNFQEKLEDGSINFEREELISPED